MDYPTNYKLLEQFLSVRWIPDYEPVCFSTPAEDNDMYNLRKRRYIHYKALEYYLAKRDRGNHNASVIDCAEYIDNLFTYGAINSYYFIEILRQWEAEFILCSNRPLLQPY